MWESANTKIKREETGQRRALSPFLSVFSRLVNCSRALYFRVFPTIWERGTGKAATFCTSPKQNKRLIQDKIKLFIAEKRLILLTFIFTCANDSHGPPQRRRSTSSFPEQRLVIEPNGYRDRCFDQKCRKRTNFRAKTLFTKYTKYRLQLINIDRSSFWTIVIFASPLNSSLNSRPCHIRT